MKNAALIIANEENNLAMNDSIKNMYILKHIFSNNIELDYLNNFDVIFVGHSIDSSLIRKIEHFCLVNNKELYIFPTSLDIRKKSLKKIGESLLLKVNDYNVNKFIITMKTIFDFLISLITIILCLPIMSIIYLLIKLEDGGPAIYLQRRLTINKKEFVIFKFRTMIKNAEKTTGAILSFKEDNRLTKIGRFLRKYRLDELPQLFNVLIGDMALIGPRPERQYFVDKFINENLYYKYRFNMKSGITGLSQINCKYDTLYSKKLDFDLYYIANYSILLDIKIIFNTIKILFENNNKNHILSKNDISMKLEVKNEKNNY